MQKPSINRHCVAMTGQSSTVPPHIGGENQASAWVRRFLPEYSGAGGDTVLDLAAGGGRHALLARSRGWNVVAVDRDTAALTGLDDPKIDVVAADLETDPPEAALAAAVGERRFAAVIVTNYLHRPLLPLLPGLLKPGGRLIYETFMAGNERFGKPSNPDFLLQPDELFMVFSPVLSVAAFEQGYRSDPTPRVIQNILAISGSTIPA